MMKHISVFFTLLLITFLCSCESGEVIGVHVVDVAVQLSYPENILSPYKGVRVELTDTHSSTFVDSTDNKGIAHFKVPAGIYMATASDQPEIDEYRYLCNGSKSEIVITDDKSFTVSLPITVTKEKAGDQIIIKEVYCGGVMSDDMSNHFHYDKCIILYNNGSREASLKNVCFGMACNYNADTSANSKLYGNDGQLLYSDFIPAINGIWYFPDDAVIAPYSQLVVNVHGAIDNTQTFSNSVNYANGEYYCMFDPTYKGSGTSQNNMYYNNTAYYPSPADVIPTSHYLHTVKVGQGNAWALSTASPAVFIYCTEDVTPVVHAEDADNLWYVPGYTGNPSWACITVPTDWIMDGVEIWNATKLNDCRKRLTASVDAGHVNQTNKLGHTVYRNVDREATESLPENNGKLVYGYQSGINDSTDPSGIDAEASMKNGAHIIFIDTNNSTTDFHERGKCSLRN